MEIALLILYTASLLFIFIYSLVQLDLTLYYRRSRKNRQSFVYEGKEWPLVTIQLPVFNEKYVIERLLSSIEEIDYPNEKLEIQVLDDSTDETSIAIEEYIRNSKRNFRHIQRENRIGFKAGALQEGLQTATGEYIAIFDADFLPPRNFLKKTLGAFDKNTGLVQTRWGHLNRDYSLLTDLQAFVLDAHFIVEQSGRKEAGSFISFNGTGGIWRKECIVDAGGWSADTLTEDLDLSYRAQMKGWNFRYLEDLESPAELPVVMSAIKSQQYRWNKGAAETARKLLPGILKSSIPFRKKIHATFHLLNSSVFVFLFIAAVLSIPVLFIKNNNPQWNLIFMAAGVFLFGFFSIAWFYWIGAKNATNGFSTMKFARKFTLFLVVSMGLSLHNAIAVLEGIFGRKTPFIRTPKFNIVKGSDQWKNNSYLNLRLSTTSIIEGLLFLYFSFGVWMGISLKDPGLLLFHSMMALGFAVVFFYSIRPMGYARK